MNIYFLLGLFIWSAIFSYFLLKILAKIWQKIGIMDRPHLYKSEMWRPPAPYSVWLVIFLTLLTFSPIIFIYGDLNPLLEKRFAIVLIVGALLNLISFIDDLDTIGKSPFRVPPIFRLGMQILVGAIIGLTSIKITYISNIFGGILSIDDLFWQFEILGKTVNIFPMLVTIVWYVLIFNAVNFSDGVPGITGGFGLISFIILGILAIKLYTMDATLASKQNSIFLLTILAIIIPVTFFLTRADIRRDVIMGDTGTLTIAFLIATLAIIAGGKIATTMSVLGVYIIDAIFVILMRIKRGQNPMKWDQDTHLHFRLMEIGLSKNQVRAVIYFLTAIFGLSAIMLSTNGKIMLFVVIAGITLFLTEILSVIKTKKSSK